MVTVVVRVTVVSVVVWLTYEHDSAVYGLVCARLLCGFPILRPSKLATGNYISFLPLNAGSGNNTADQDGNMYDVHTSLN